MVMMLRVVAVIPKTRLTRDCVELEAIDEAGAMTGVAAVDEDRMLGCARRNRIALAMRL
jgi:hypothetical protein